VYVGQGESRCVDTICTNLSIYVEVEVRVKRLLLPALYCTGLFFRVIDNDSMDAFGDVAQFSLSNTQRVDA